MQVKRKVSSPLIEELVDLLYTEELNNLIDTICVSNLDKRSFMMFVMMYFYSRLSAVNNVTKESLKSFLTELIMDNDKRKKCIDIYRNFEKSVNGNNFLTDM